MENQRNGVVKAIKLDYSFQGNRRGAELRRGRRGWRLEDAVVPDADHPQGDYLILISSAISAASAPLRLPWDVSMEQSRIRRWVTGPV